jgi:ankyrin repeat protein
MTAPHLMEQADEDGFKPIHLAVIQGTLETVNLLLANKVNVNALDNEGHSVVHWATGKACDVGVSLVIKSSII